MATNAQKNARKANMNAPAAKGAKENVSLNYEDPSQLPMTRINFILMAVCGLLIVIGFCLMAGGATTTDSFNPDIFSARRIIVGPGMAFIGFVAMAFAIMYRPKHKESAK